MSGTTTPLPVGTTTATAPPPDPIWTPQTIIALALVVIAAGTVAGVFYVGDPQTRSQTVGGVMTLAGMVGGFYFGSSKSSQGKDATLAQIATGAPPPATVTVTPAPPPVPAPPATPPAEGPKP